jgi:hypothetical protein
MINSRGCYLENFFIVILFILHIYPIQKKKHFDVIFCVNPLRDGPPAKHNRVKGERKNGECMILMLGSITATQIEYLINRYVLLIISCCLGKHCTITLITQ